MPSRRLFGVPAIVIALGLCIWATTARGLFDGVTLLAGMCGVLSLGLLLLPSRPRLKIEVRDQSDPLRLELVPGWSDRCIDKQAIVRQQINQALATMPEQPKPQVEDDAPISKVLLAHAAAGLQASFTGTTDEDIQEFESKVSAYGRELTSWLEELEKSRDQHLRVFECDLRLHELGHAAADHVHLRLRFPKGFLLASKLLRVGAPPRCPNFAPGIGAILPKVVYDPPLLPELEPLYLPGTDKAKYSMEGDAPVIDYELGRVNQHDHRDVPTFSLRLPAPGTYAVQWEASASGLDKLARGQFAIHFAEPEQGQAITTLAEVEAEREKYQ